MAQGWLTPDSLPESHRLMSLIVPDDEAFYSMLIGALVPLFDEANYEKIGTLTPEETAQYWVNWDGWQEYSSLADRAYWQLLRDMRITDLIAYFRGDELSGSTLHDSGLSGLSASLSNGSFGASGMGDGYTAPSLSNAAGYIDLYSSALASLFDGQEGTLVFWVKAGGVSTWSDGLTHYIARLYADTNNYLSVFKWSTNQIAAYYKAGGVLKSFGVTTTSLSPMCIALRWSLSNDVFEMVFNGAHIGAIGSLGTWIGGLVSNICLMGNDYIGGASAWPGTLGHIGLWSRYLSANELRLASRMFSLM